jgi:UDP-glucose 4-epimerase
VLSPDRILVTGGAGFIGSHVVERLAAGGATLRVLDDLSTGRPQNLPPDVELLVGDVTDRGMVERAAHGVGAIIHLAAIASVTRSIEDWVRAHQVNLTGTVVILDAAAKQPVPVIYASSAAVYGDNPHSPLAETATPKPLSPYAADKLAGEWHARAAGAIRGIPSVGLRLFNVYGPRQDPTSPYSGVISIFADRVARDEPLIVHGDGGQTRDFVYVEDVADAFCAALRGALEAPAAARVFNVCTGRGISITALATAVAAAYGRTPALRSDPPRSGDIRHSVGDPRAAVEALGFKADTDLSSGLQKLAAYGPGQPARTRSS